MRGGRGLQGLMGPGVQLLAAGLLELEAQPEPDLHRLLRLRRHLLIHRLLRNLKPLLVLLGLLVTVGPIGAAA